MFSKDYLGFIIDINYDLEGNIIAKPKSEIPQSFYYKDKLALSRWAMRYIQDIEVGKVYFKHLKAKQGTVADTIIHSNFLEEYPEIIVEIKLLLLEFASIKDIMLIDEAGDKYFRLLNDKDLTDIIHTIKYVLDVLGTDTDYPDIYDFFQEMYITFGYIRKNLTKLFNDMGVD